MLTNHLLKKNTPIYRIFDLISVLVIAVGETALKQLATDLLVSRIDPDMPGSECIDFDVRLNTHAVTPRGSR
jgi:hypothetical protein